MHKQIITIGRQYGSGGRGEHSPISRRNEVEMGNEEIGMENETDIYALIFYVNHRLFLIPVCYVMYIDKFSEFTAMSDMMLPHIFGTCDSRGNTVKLVSLESIIDETLNTNLFQAPKPLIVLNNYFGIVVDEILGVSCFGNLQKTSAFFNGGKINGVYIVNGIDELAFELNIPQIVGMQKAGD